MEITFTRTTEYVIEIDDTDADALAGLQAILTAAGVEGSTLVDQVQNLHSFDPQDALTALAESALSDVAGDSYVTDGWDCDGLSARWGGEWDDEDESDREEPTTAPLILPGFVTGEGFVAASLT